MRALKLVVTRKGKDYTIPVPSTEVGVAILVALVYGLWSGAITVDVDIAIRALHTAIETISS